LSCSDLGDDARHFTSTSLDDVATRDIFGNLGFWSEDVSHITVTNRDTETSVEQENLPILLDQNSALPPNAPTAPINATTPIPSPHHIVEYCNCPQKSSGWSLRQRPWRRGLWLQAIRSLICMTWLQHIQASEMPRKAEQAGWHSLLLEKRQKLPHYQIILMPQHSARTCELHQSRTSQ